MKLASITFISLFLYINVEGQKSLTKDEILNSWISQNGNNSKAIVDFDSAWNARLEMFLDTLQTNKIDSIIIFSTAFPGYSSASKCDNGIFPITTFVIWNKNGKTSIMKIRRRCLSEISSDTSLNFFDFFNDNYKQLKSEYFMPVILGAEMNKDKSITYSYKWVDHEPNYSFYYTINGNSRSFHFCQSYIENKESLFRVYNLGLASYSWWQEVKNQLEKLE